MKFNMLNKYILLLSSIFYFIFWAQFSGSYNPIAPDSNGYLYFFSGTDAGFNRLAGYPAFLLLMTNLKFSLIQIGYIQLGIFVFSLYFFLDSLLRFGISKVIVGLLFIGLLANPFFNKFHFIILTESLSFSFLLIFLGLIIFLIRGITNARIILLGTVIGFLAAMKPVSLIFFPIGLITLFMLFLISNSRSFQKNLLSLFLLCAPCLIILSAEKVVFFSAHDEKYSQITEHFYGKSIMSTTFSNYKSFDDNLPESEMLKLLDEKYSSDQKYLESLEDFSEKLAIYSLLENDAYKHADLNNELARIASENDLEPLELKKAIIFYSLKNNPSVFLIMTLRHYFSFFNIYPSGEYYNKNGGPEHLINQAIDFSPSAARSLVHNSFLIFGGLFYLFTILILIKSLQLMFLNNFIKYLKANQIYLLVIILTVLTHSIHLSHAIFGVYVPRYLMFSYPYIILFELLVIQQIVKLKKFSSTRKLS